MWVRHLLPGLQVGTRRSTLETSLLGESLRGGRQCLELRKINSHSELRPAGKKANGLLATRGHMKPIP